MKRFFRHITRPEIFHGAYKKPPYFEGWYFKLVDSNQQNCWAIIPGLFIGHSDEQTHAFIQILNGQDHSAVYHRFPITQFVTDHDTFLVNIQDNTFSANGLTISLDAFQADLVFHNTQSWPVTIRSPGIMGWYAWVPFMECYHGVVSLDHSITGKIKVGDDEKCLDGGRGYIEKDWGKSFPQTWIWTQGNHFEATGTSFTASIARIPWVGKTFTGFIIGLSHDQKLYRFATYTGAKITQLKISDNRVIVAIESKTHRLEFESSRDEYANLTGPTPNGMTNIVRESIDAVISVKLRELNGSVIFEGQSAKAGLEIEGDTSLLV